VFSGVFIAEEDDAVGDMGSGDTTMIDVQTFSEAFFKMSAKSADFYDEAFSGLLSSSVSLSGLTHYTTLY
jgi:hypothetical protein